MTVRFYMDQEWVFLGSMFTTNFEVRDSDGRLYDPDEHPTVLEDNAMPVEIYALADDGTVAGEPVAYEVANLVVLQGCPQPGRYRAEIDSTDLSVGRFLLRANIPWASGKVNAQMLLEVKDPSAPLP